MSSSTDYSKVRIVKSHIVHLFPHQPFTSQLERYISRSDHLSAAQSHRCQAHSSPRPSPHPILMGLLRLLPLPRFYLHAQPLRLLDGLMMESQTSTICRIGWCISLLAGYIARWNTRRTWREWLGSIPLLSPGADVNLIAQQNCDRLAAMAAGCELWIYEQMKDKLRGHLGSATRIALA